MSFLSLALHLTLIKETLVWTFASLESDEFMGIVFVCTLLI